MSPRWPPIHSAPGMRSSSTSERLGFSMASDRSGVSLSLLSRRRTHELECLRRYGVDLRYFVECPVLNACPLHFPGTSLWGVVSWTSSLSRTGAHSLVLGSI